MARGAGSSPAVGRGGPLSAPSCRRAVGRNGSREPDLGRFFHGQIGLVGQPAHLIQVKVSLVSCSIRSLHIGGLKSAITKTSGGAAAPRHY